MNEKWHKVRFHVNEMADCENQCSGNSRTPNISLCDVFILAPWFRYSYFFCSFWIGLVWFVLLRWFVFSSVFHSKHRMAYHKSTHTHNIRHTHSEINICGTKHTHKVRCHENTEICLPKRKRMWKAQNKKKKNILDSQKNTHGHIYARTAQHILELIIMNRQSAFSPCIICIECVYVRIMILFCVA